MTLRLFVPLVLAAAAVGAAPAHAAPPLVVTCGLHASPDPTGTVANPGTFIGTLDGGPVVTSTPGTIGCSVQVGGTGVFADADAAYASASGTGVVHLVPTTTSFQSGPTDPVWLCTTWTGTGGPLFYDVPTGQWVTSPSVARCDLAVRTFSQPPRVDVTNRVVEAPVGPLLVSCTTVGVTVCASYTTGTVVTQVVLGSPTASGLSVAGYQDSYRFTLPTGGVAVLPCIVLLVNKYVNPCAIAGGTFVSRDLVLFSTETPETAGPTFVSAGVCNATWRLTVNSFGVTSFPAYAIC